MSRRSGLFGRRDPWIFYGAAFIAFLGVLNLWSAASAGNKGPIHLKQLAWFLLGTGVVALLQLVDYRAINRWSFRVYGVCLAVLALVPFFGHAIAGGVRSWLHVWKFSVQPSEFMKIGLILALARYFSTRSFDPPHRLRDLVVPSILLVLPLGLILKEPDMGTAIAFILIFGSIVLFVGMEARSIVLVLVLISLTLGGAWIVKGSPFFFLKEYHNKRLLTFLDPESDPLGVGYHVIHSKIAVGSGGWTGKGYKKGTQAHASFLPEHHTDFAFSVIAEEEGFVGSVIVLLAFGFLIVRSLQIASWARDEHGVIVCVGFAAMVFWHCMVNIGMVLGVMPVIGIPLPLISYGGSSALSLMIGVGLVMNVSSTKTLF